MYPWASIKFYLDSADVTGNGYGDSEEGNLSGSGGGDGDYSKTLLFQVGGDSVDGDSTGNGASKLTTWFWWLNVSTRE